MYKNPSNVPKPFDKRVDVCMFVESNNSGDKQTRHSHNSFLIYVNTALVDWHSEHQATIEAGVFGAEFAIMQTRVDTLRGLRYTCRMMGSAIDDTTHVYGAKTPQNQIPESTLN